MVTKNISSNGLGKRRQAVQHIGHFPNEKEWWVTREIFNSIKKKKERDFYINAAMAGCSEDKGGWK